MLTVIIPSKNEKFLDNTIRDVLQNATGDIQIIPILDGYEPPERVIDPRVDYLQLPATNYSKKRQGINQAVDLAKGEYIMALDAHCLVAEGFDEQLIKDHQPSWIQIPRRHRLDAENWCLQTQSDTRPPIDYEYIMFNPLLDTKSIHGFRWDSRTLTNFDKKIDDTITFQGSCWFMTKAWFKERGFMDIRYQGWGQEAEELSFETWKNGGEVKTNKNTYYAHLHKGNKYGRMYFLDKKENRKSYDYSYDMWMVKNQDFWFSLIEKFPRMPGWTDDWKDKLRYNK